MSEVTARAQVVLGRVVQQAARLQGAGTRSSFSRFKQRMRQGTRLVKREAQSFNLRKPLHASLAGLMVAGIAAPIITQALTDHRYVLDAQQRSVIAKPSPSLLSKLSHDSTKAVSLFNPDGVNKLKSGNPDVMATAVGGAGDRANQLYSATLPDDASKGITVTDNVNDMKVTITPLFGLMNGRAGKGRVSYPLSDQAGQLIMTPKGNGLKEDILLDNAPASDSATYQYRLDLPDTLEARLDADGSVGIYSGDPMLYGNISYGTDNDRTKVEQARKAAAKTYKMFSLPAPTVKSTQAGNLPTAHFALDGKTLSVHIQGLKHAHYPLSIDPTFVLTSTSDFVLGSIDDNIDLSVSGQVGRQALVGGSTQGWTPNSAPSLSYAQFAAGLVAYNGYLYLIGGGSGAVGGAGTAGTTTNDVRYISLDATTGALGTGTPTTWTQTSLMLTARQGLVAFGFNGYLYAVGGQDNNGAPITRTGTNQTVEYAKINANGSVGTWAYTNGLNTVRAYPAGAQYEGLLYVMGGTSGSNNATPQSTIEYARINGDGTMGTWTQSSSTATGTLTSARSKFRAGAYNGYVYITGGQTSTTVVINTVQYAPILASGGLGPWVTSSAFATARRDHGMAINNGYIYVFGGCSGAAQACAGFIADTQYAVINADGTIGQWQSTVPYNTGGFNSRMPGGVTQYSNHLYFVGGCSAETATNNCATQLVGTFITDVDPVGRFDRGLSTSGTAPYTGSGTDARMGAKSVALNGFFYHVSGCSSPGCETYDGSVTVAPINADGTLGAFTATTSLPATGANSPGRLGHTVAAYNNTIYVVGGTERPAALNISSVTPTLVGTASTVHNIAMPATVNAGDLLLMLFATPGGTNTTNATPAGWTQVTTGTRATAARSTVYAKTANGTEGGTTVGVTTSGTTNTVTAAAQVYQVDAGSWFGNATTGVAAATVDPGNTTTTPNPPALTPAWGAAGNLWLAAVGAASYTTTTTYPAGYTNGAHIVTGSGTTGASMASARLVAYGATQDPGTFTEGSNSSGVPMTIAIRPLDDTATTYMSTILTATQNSNGTLGSWSTQASLGGNDLPAARAFHTTEIWHNFIYVLGGRDAANVYGTIYYAPISTSGTIGTWNTATTGIQARWGHSGGIWGNWIYVNSGNTTTGGTYIGTTAAANAVQRLTLDETTGNVTAATGYASTTARRFAAGFVDKGFLYSFGGDLAASASVDISWAPLDPSTGAVGTMVATNIGNRGDLTDGLATARSAVGGVSMGGYFYVTGGCTSVIATASFRGCSSFVAAANMVEMSLPNNGGTGQTGTWAGTTALPSARADQAAVAFNDRLYVLGGCTSYSGGVCNGNTSEVRSVDIQPDGTLGSTWATENALPSARSQLQAVAYNGYMYAIGGRSSGSGASNTVWYAPIQATGTLGSWVDASGNYLPAGQDRRNFGLATSNGYLYVAGGEDATGTPKNDVYYAPLAADGSVGTWTGTTSYTTARGGLSLIAYNGVLYVIGGYNGGALTDIQYASLATNGSVASWGYTTDVSRGMAVRQAVAANGYMYFVGNESDGNDSAYVSINANGTLGQMQDSVAGLTAAHPHGSSVIYQGVVYTLGGCPLSGIACTGVIANTEKAGQQAISRVGHYSKLFDTQVDTSPTQLVVNGANAGPTSAVELKVSTASSSDPVLGVAQLFRPIIFGNFYNVQALNSSGTNVGVAFNYLYNLTLDDSRSGTFPDVVKTGFSQTAVTDITLYYHANPKRRLRHGASFTNTGCNPDPTQGCLLDTAP